MIKAIIWWLVLFGLSIWAWTRLSTPCHDWFWFLVLFIMFVAQSIMVLGFIVGFRHNRKSS